MAKMAGSGPIGTDPQAVGRGDLGANHRVAGDGSVAGGDSLVSKVGDAPAAPEACNAVESDMDHAEGDLLGAVISAADASIGHTLDQLTTATDLFDVPALDFDDGLPT